MLALIIYMNLAQFAECIILDKPLLTNMIDLYKLRNEMAVQLLNASGIRCNTTYTQCLYMSLTYII